MDDEEITPDRLGVTADLVWPVDPQLIATVALVAGMIALRLILVRLIRRGAEVPSDGQRRWVLVVQRLTTVSILAGLLILWGQELEAFALSIAAISVAVVIATKELLMSFAGGILRSTSGAYTVGDWIEIGPHSGEVVDLTALGTQLAEIDRVELEHTGRTIMVPNALLWTHPVVNHGFRKRYIFHEFTIFSEPVPQAEEARRRIEAAVRDASADFREVAMRYASVLRRRAGIALPDPAPTVRIRTTEFGKLRFEVRLFCPRDRASAMEQAATRAWLAWVDGQPWRFVGVAPREAALSGRGAR